MKKIAILLPKISDGGTQRVASTLSLNLPKEYEQHLFVYFIDKVDYAFNAKITNINRPIKNNYIAKFFNFLIRTKKLAQLKKANQIDVSISFGPNVENIFSKKHDYVINTVHNVLSVEFKHWGFFGTCRMIFTKSFFNKADIIITVSKYIKYDLIKNFGICEDKIKVVYNPHNIKTITSASHDLLDEQFIEIFNKPTIVTAGRLSFQKGQWFLIRIISQVIKSIPDIQLVILGDGPDKDNLLSLASDLGVKANVHILPFQQNPHKFFKNAKIFALTSLYEGFPNVLVEALACSVPIISTDCKSGPRELLAPDTDMCFSTDEIELAKFGILAPALPPKMFKASDPLTKEEELFTKAVMLLLNDKSACDKYISNGLLRANDFDVSQIVKQYVNIIDNNL